MSFTKEKFSTKDSAENAAWKLVLQDKIFCKKLKKQGIRQNSKSLISAFA